MMGGITRDSQYAAAGGIKDASELRDIGWLITGKVDGVKKETTLAAKKQEDALSKGGAKLKSMFPGKNITDIDAQMIY